MGCTVIGSGCSDDVLRTWLTPWQEPDQAVTLFLVLAGTATAEVEGISAAGATAAARRFTALADAELLLFGPGRQRRWPLPPLPAGVSPALISRVAAEWLGLTPLVAAAGLPLAPQFPHLRLEPANRGPAACLSSGQAMDLKRVQVLWQRGWRLGKGLRGPLLLAECVPGGTTTAQAVLTGLGLSVADLISGSARIPPMNLKQSLVERGLRAAQLPIQPSPQSVLAAVGDPFQALAAGLLLGAMEADQPVLLGGGSQMVAVLALALAAEGQTGRQHLAEGVCLGTTAWLAAESDRCQGRSGALGGLLDRTMNHFGVQLKGLATGLRFEASRHSRLRDYELGFVKEGVGAGALSLLAQLRGASIQELLEACDRAMDHLAATEGSSARDCPVGSQP